LKSLKLKEYIVGSALTVIYVDGVIYYLLLKF